MTISVTTLLILLFVHFVADFVFQTDKMATNKSTSNEALISHIFVYSACLFYGVGILSGFLPGLPLHSLTMPWPFLGWVGLNAVAHFATDYITSRMTSKFWKAGKRHEFFVTIGFDQFLHAAVLVLSWVFLIGA